MSKHKEGQENPTTFVLDSEIRRKVVIKTSIKNIVSPSNLHKEIKYPRESISRAISELKSRGLMESADETGVRHRRSFYRLTKKGKILAKELVEMDYADL